MIHIKSGDLANVCSAQVQGFVQKMPEEPVVVKNHILLWCLNGLIFSNSKRKTFPFIVFNTENLFPFSHILLINISWWLVKKGTACVILSIYSDAPFLRRAHAACKQIWLSSIWILYTSRKKCSAMCLRNEGSLSPYHRQWNFIPSVWASWHLWRCFKASAIYDTYVPISPREIIFIVQLNKVKVRECGLSKSHISELDTQWLCLRSADSRFQALFFSQLQTIGKSSCSCVSHWSYSAWFILFCGIGTPRPENNAWLPH